MISILTNNTGVLQGISYEMDYRKSRISCQSVISYILDF